LYYVADYGRDRTSSFLTSQTVEGGNFDWQVLATACFGGCAAGVLSDVLDLADDAGVAGLVSADFDEASVDRVLSDARLSADIAADEGYYAINGEVIPENSDAFAATNVAQKIRKYRFDVSDQLAGAWTALIRMREEKPPESLQAATERQLQMQELEARLDLYTDGAYTRAKLME
jgi:hypothetical protein